MDMSGCLKGCFSYKQKNGHWVEKKKDNYLVSLNNDEFFVKGIIAK